MSRGAANTQERPPSSGSLTGSMTTLSERHGRTEAEAQRHLAGGGPGPSPGRRLRRSAVRFQGVWSSRGMVRGDRVVRSEPEHGGCLSRLPGAVRPAGVGGVANPGDATERGRPVPTVGGQGERVVGQDGAHRARRRGSSGGRWAAVASEPTASSSRTVGSQVNSGQSRHAMVYLSRREPVRDDAAAVLPCCTEAKRRRARGVADLPSRRWVRSGGGWVLRGTRGHPSRRCI